MLSITPQIIFANSNISDRYKEANSVQAIVNDAEVHVYVTQKGGTVELTGSNKVETTFPQGSGYREYKAIPADGWIWKGWTYEQFYRGNDLGNRTDFGGNDIPSQIAVLIGKAHIMALDRRFLSTACLPQMKP